MSLYPACNQTSRVMFSKADLMLVVGSDTSPRTRNSTDIADLCYWQHGILGSRRWSFQPSACGAWTINHHGLALRTVSHAIAFGNPAHNHNECWHHQSTIEPRPFRSTLGHLMSSGRFANPQLTAGNVCSGKDDVLPIESLRKSSSRERCKTITV